MNIPLAKLKAILLFFGNYTDTKFLGKVKLMKLFYFLDFMHVKKYGTPITYDTYVNLEHGPIPSGIKNLVDTASDDVDDSILADTISFETPQGTRMCRVIPSRKFTEKDEKLFSKSEMEILNVVCQRFKDSNTKTIEQASHDEAPWKETSLLDAIPYTLAAKDPDCIVSFADIELALRLSK
jgi:uncharacterized phage-associated protein